MSGNVHPNSGPIFPCSVCAGNVTWRGKSVQCCACSKWVHLRCSQLSLSKFRALGSSHSWSCPLYRNTVTPPSSDSSDMYTSTVQSGPPLLMLHSRSTLVSKLLIPHLPITYLLPLPPTTVPRSWLYFCTSCLLSPLTLSGFFNGMLEVFEPGALNYFTFFHPILSTLSAFRNPILTHLPLSGFLDSLLCALTAPTPGLSPDTTHASGVVIFIRQGLSFSELSISSLSSLDPCSDYVGINISLNNFSSLSFLNVYAPLFAPLQRMAEPISSLPPSFLPPEISSFLGTSIAITPSGTQEVPPTPAGRKYSTGSFLLTSSPSMILTHPPFSTDTLAVALSLTSPLLPPLLLFPAPGRCFRALVLTICQFFYPSLSLRSFAPTSVPLPSTFRKLWDGFASYFDSHCPSAEEYLSLSSTAALFTSLTLNAAKSSIPFGRIKRPPKAWWFAEVEQAVSERRKAFAAAHRSDEDRQAYISPSRRASSVIAKAKTEAWQTTCSSLSPKSNPKTVHSLLRSIAGSPSSSSSSPNFSNCSSLRESALVYAAYLRSHFSVSQPKTLRSRARGYLSELRQATCSEESHSSFCSPFSLAEFLAAASNLSSSTATGPDKVAYPMLKHLPRSGMDLLLHIFNLSWSLHSFPSIWKTSIIPI